MDIWSVYGDAIWLTVRLSLVTTLCLLVVGVPLAWWLARSQSPFKPVIAALVSAPLVLPPTVIGFYVLIALGPQGPGGWIAGLWGGRTLAFSFEGLVLGSILYSLPFMVGPVRVAFEGISGELMETAAGLGARPLAAFGTVALPLARSGVLAGAVLSFAHTVGEFGVVLMIGGNIPGETKVLSIAMFDAVERLEWAEAHVLALSMVVFALVVVGLTQILDQRAGQIGR
jgi:molybdate transport system permease protein